MSANIGCTAGRTRTAKVVVLYGVERRGLVDGWRSCLKFIVPRCRSASIGELRIGSDIARAGNHATRCAEPQIMVEGKGIVALGPVPRVVHLIPAASLIEDVVYEQRVAVPGAAIKVQGCFRSLDHGVVGDRHIAQPSTCLVVSVDEVVAAADQNVIAHRDVFALNRDARICFDGDLDAGRRMVETVEFRFVRCVDQIFLDCHIFGIVEINVGAVVIVDDVALHDAAIGQDKV